MATSIPNRFPDNAMMSLTNEKVRYDLAESVGPDLTLSDVLSEQDYQSLAALKLDYRTAAGAQQLRAEIARRHAVSDDDVVVTIGGMQAIFLVASTLCTGDDHVVISEPVFPLAAGAVSIGGAAVDTVRCQFDDGYRIDIRQMIDSLKSTTRLVCIASPQNPSGVTVPEVDLKQLLDGMQRICPNAFLLLDETYREATYGTTIPQPSCVTLGDQVISCASLSKCHGASGLRIGWAISTQPELVTQLIRGKFQSVIACSAIDEALALRVLQRSDTLLSDRRQHLEQGKQCVANWVAARAAAVEWVEPNAGALCCLRLNPQYFGHAEIVAFYEGLERQSVRVAPGAWFGDEAGVFRLGFGLLPIPELQQALELVGHVLDNTHIENQSA